MSRRSKQISRKARDFVPRGQERRRQIAVIAERVFLTHGYVNTTMQRVALEAGASKGTLYRHFGSKEELFAEVMSNGAHALRSRLDANFERQDAIGCVLTDIGTTLLEAMTNPTIVALLRMIVAETPRDSTLGRLFHVLGPGRTRVCLTEYLTQARTRGEFVGEEPALAAGIFLSAITGQILLDCLTLTDLPLMPQAAIEAHVAEVVAMFLRRYAPTTQPMPSRWQA